MKKNVLVLVLALVCSASMIWARGAGSASGGGGGSRGGGGGWSGGGAKGWSGTGGARTVAPGVPRMAGPGAGVVGVRGEATVLFKTDQTLEMPLGTVYGWGNRGYGGSASHHFNRGANSNGVRTAHHFNHASVSQKAEGNRSLGARSIQGTGWPCFLLGFNIQPQLLPRASLTSHGFSGSLIFLPLHGFKSGHEPYGLLCGEQGIHYRGEWFQPFRERAGPSLLAQLERQSLLPLSRRLGMPRPNSPAGCLWSRRTATAASKKCCASRRCPTARLSGTTDARPFPSSLASWSLYLRGA